MGITSLAAIRQASLENRQLSMLCLSTHAIARFAYILRLLSIVFNLIFREAFRMRCTLFNQAMKILEN